jgi:predicted transcriptional regulator
MHWTSRDVARFRRSLGLSQVRFAELLGTAQPVISRIERGHAEVSPMLARLLTCMKERQELEKKLAAATRKPTPE